MMVMRRMGNWFEAAPYRILVVPFLFLFLLFIVPLAVIVFVSIFYSGKFELGFYEDSVLSSSFFYVILRTFRISLIVSAVCLLLGYPYAYLIYKSSRGLKTILIAMILVPFFTSILIRSYAWVALLGNRGAVNALLIQLGIIDAPIQLVFNEIGTLIGMSQILLPIMVLTIYGTMQRIDGTLLHAAESLGAHPLMALCKVFVPLTFPGIAAGLGLVFTSSLGFYVTPALLGGQGQYMVAQSIYAQLNALNDIGGAAAQATVLLVIVTILLWLLRHILIKGTDGPEPLRHATGSVQAITWFTYFPQSLFRFLGRGGTVLSAGASLIFALMTLASAAMLLMTLITVIPLGFSGDAFLRFPPSSFSLRWIVSYLQDDAWIQATYFSLWISIGAAILAGVTGTIAAYSMVKWTSHRKSLVEIFFISPMIIPQFVIALALYVIFIRLNIVGHPVTYILAYGVFGFPFVFLIMYAVFQRFDFSVVSAAAISGAKPWAISTRIVIPIVMPALLSALVFAFLTAFDDLVVGLFFSTAGNYTLPMRMWDDIRNEISPQIAAVAVVFCIAALSAMAALWLSKRLYWLWNRRHVTR